MDQRCGTAHACLRAADSGRIRLVSAEGPAPAPFNSVAMAGFHHPSGILFVTIINVRRSSTASMVPPCGLKGVRAWCAHYASLSHSDQDYSHCDKHCASRHPFKSQDDNQRSPRQVCPRRWETLIHSPRSTWSPHQDSHNVPKRPVYWAEAEWRVQEALSANEGLQLYSK